MRELTCHEIALVSGADGEEEAAEVNVVCSALGDAATAAAMAAVLQYGSWTAIGNAGVASIAGATANSAVSSGCQQISDELYTFASALIQEFEDSAYSSLNVNWY